MADKVALHALKSGLVLDRGVLIEQSVSELTATIATLRAAEGNTPLFVISDAESFFTPNTLIDCVAHQDAQALIINEKIGFFTQEQLNALMGVEGNTGEQIAPHAVHEEGVVALGQPAANKPIQGYTYAPVPAGWTIANNMSLGPTKIRRKVKSAEGDGTAFFMSPAAYEKLWNFAALVWVGVDGAPTKAMFATGMGQKQAIVEPTRISIGGNYIQRYELEQVAKYRGWGLPVPEAKVAA